jgi:hypothetical protein
VPRLSQDFFVPDSTLTAPASGKKREKNREKTGKKRGKTGENGEKGKKWEVFWEVHYAIISQLML